MLQKHLFDLLRAKGQSNFIANEMQRNAPLLKTIDSIAPEVLDATQSISERYASLCEPHSSISSPLWFEGQGEFASAVQKVNEMTASNPLNLLDAVSNNVFSGEVITSQALLREKLAEVIRASEQFGPLSKFIPPPEQAFAVISRAAVQSASLTNALSFAEVGFAVTAAANLFKEQMYTGGEYDPFLDPFFGDWSRIDQLPVLYGIDHSCRREVFEEIGADDALFDLNAGEASVIVRETSFALNGVPLEIFDEAIGLEIVQDPDDIACRLIRKAERKIRQFIDLILTARYGPEWPRSLMPDRAEEWEARRQIDARQGLKVYRLIEYADFPELASIIKDRWQDGFAGKAKKPSSVTKLIHALAPHRNYEFHSRPVTPEQLIAIVQLAFKIESWLNSHS